MTIIGISNTETRPDKVTEMTWYENCAFLIYKSSILKLSNTTCFRSLNSYCSFQTFRILHILIVLSEDILHRSISHIFRGEKVDLKIGVKTCTVWCLPTQHWCQRSAFDRNKVILQFF